MSLHEKHQPRHESLARQLNDLEKPSKYRQAQNRHESPGLELVRNPKSRGGLVEPVFLLEDKNVIVAPWQGREGGEKGEGGYPEQGVGDLHGWPPISSTPYTEMMMERGRTTRLSLKPSWPIHLPVICQLAAYTPKRISPHPKSWLYTVLRREYRVLSLPYF
jgi:hypothetical protein